MMEMRGMIQAQIPGNLPDSARNWLTLAIDPFHDTRVDPAPIPDEDSTPVIVSVLKDMLTIKRPASVPAGSSWDFHVFQTPFLEASFIFRGTVSKRTTTRVDGLGTSAITTSDAEAITALPNDPDTGAIMAGFITVVSAPAGVGLDMASIRALTHEVQCFYVDDMTRLRVGSAGVEVINTTAQLYKGGQVTAYRIPTNVTECEALTIWHGTGVTLPGAGSTTNVVPPWVVPVITDVYNDVPKRPEEAIDYLTATAWGAEDGAYLICPVDPIAPFEAPHIRRMIGTTSMGQLTSSGSPCSFDASWSMAAGSAITGDAGKTLMRFTRRGVQSRHTLVADRVGAFFTGLHSDSTFTVETRVLQEIAPVIGDPDGQRLVTLARPPPPACPVAIELYQRLSRTMPAAVPRTLNPNGEWWDLVVSKIRQLMPVIAPVARALHPVAGIAADAVARAVEKKVVAPVKKEVREEVKRVKAAVAKSKPAPQRKRTTQ